MQETNSGANFKQLCLERAVARTHNIRLKEILKRRALRGKQRVELLMNSAGKRTVVLLNPSFFYFAFAQAGSYSLRAVGPSFFVIGYAFTSIEL